MVVEERVVEEMVSKEMVVEEMAVEEMVSKVMVVEEMVIEEKTKRGGGDDRGGVGVSKSTTEFHRRHEMQRKKFNR